MGTKFERKSNLFANLGLQILATNERRRVPANRQIKKTSDKYKNSQKGMF